MALRASSVLAPEAVPPPVPLLKRAIRPRRWRRATGGAAMETIARIPALACEAAGLNAAAGRTEPDCRRRPAFPIRSIAILAVFATIAWTLATWSEQARLRRQRQPVRLAREPAATVQETITP